MILQTGYPSIDKPWLKYYKVKPEDLVYPKKTLYQFIWDNNKDYLNDVAFQYFGKKITYREFFDNVKKAARALTSMGIRKGDIVTIMSMHTPETIYIVYGANYLGITANMVYPSLSAEELKHTIEDTDSKAVFIMDVVIDSVKTTVNDLTIPVISIQIDESMPIPIKTVSRLKSSRYKGENIINYRDFVGMPDCRYKCHQVCESDFVAAIVYTSGTMGKPKGVMLTNDCINALAIQDYNGVMQFERGKTCLMILPPFIGFGITQMHIMLGAGVIQILQIQLEPKVIMKNLFKYNPYVFMTGPALIAAFLEHNNGNLSNIKYFIGGGGAVTEEQTRCINEKLRKCGSTAVYSNGYGMTEAASLLCASANEISKINSVGIPFVDTNVKIVDTENGNQLVYNEIGELWFSTPNLMSGYYNNSADTEVISEDDDGTRWLKTGDLGTVDEDGFVFITGRLKRIFITKGKDNMAYKLFPQHIEDVLTKMEEVSSCGVTVVEHKERINVAIAYVVPRDTVLCTDTGRRKQLLTKINEYAKEKLSDHMVPAEIKLIESMPVTPSGKIDYKKLNG